MTDRKSPDPTLDEYKDTARTSQQAEIADESAAYVSSAEPGDEPSPAEEAEGHPS